MTFHYLEWTIQKELRRRHEGKLYQVSPWSLTWDDENYYLVAYDKEDEKIKHYRVDKMEDIGLAPGKRLGREQFRDFDLAVFAKKTFGMYGGKDTKVTLQCDGNLAGVVIDRFGKCRERYGLQRTGVKTGYIGTIQLKSIFASEILSKYGRDLTFLRKKSKRQ